MTISIFLLQLRRSCFHWFNFRIYWIKALRSGVWGWCFTWSSQTGKCIDAHLCGDTRRIIVNVVVARVGMGSVCTPLTDDPCESLTGSLHTRTPYIKCAHGTAQLVSVGEKYEWVRNLPVLKQRCVALCWHFHKTGVDFFCHFVFWMLASFSLSLPSPNRFVTWKILPIPNLSPY